VRDELWRQRVTRAVFVIVDCDGLGWAMAAIQRSARRPRPATPFARALKSQAPVAGQSCGGEPLCYDGPDARGSGANPISGPPRRALISGNTVGG
jgi:hypothetical protein